MFNHLLRENVNPTASTTHFRGISCTRHDAIIRTNWGAWRINFVVAILNNISQRSRSTLKQGIAIQHSCRRENKPTIRIGRTDITAKKTGLLFHIQHQHTYTQQWRRSRNIIEWSCSQNWCTLQREACGMGQSH
jgi:hypothetical protein